MLIYFSFFRAYSCVLGQTRFRRSLHSDHARIVPLWIDGCASVYDTVARRSESCLTHLPQNQAAPQLALYSCFLTKDCYWLAL